MNINVIQQNNHLNAIYLRSQIKFISLHMNCKVKTGHLWAQLCLTLFLIMKELEKICNYVGSIIIMAKMLWKKKTIFTENICNCSGIVKNLVTVPRPWPPNNAKYSPLPFWSKTMYFMAKRIENRIELSLLPRVSGPEIPS